MGGEDVKSAEVGTDKGRSGLPGGREEGRRVAQRNTVSRCSNMHMLDLKMLKLSP